MTEPAKPREIEDVLSSIRRLVSEEAQAMTRPAPGASDRLVLTPALRVPADKTDGGQGAHARPPEPSATVQAGVGRRTGDATHRAEAPTSPGLHPADIETGAGAGRAVDHGTDRTSPLPGDRTGDSGRHAEVDAPAVEDGPEEASLEARVAELEAAVSDFDDAWEPDGTEEAHDDRPDGRSAGPTDPFHGDDSWIPDGGAGDDFDDDPLFGGSEETALLDEDMLRDLVSDIVRQELQGALGERITRNVRKLVRREISRAMAARDFE